MKMNRSLAVLATVITVALVAAGCGGSSEDTSTTVDGNAGAAGVVFDRGSVPEAVPDSFPIPDEAVIGATLVDTNRGLTEMILTFPASAEAVVAYYEENLPLSGYEITSSDGTDSEWVIEFSGEGIEGRIRINAGGSGLSSATVQLTNA